MDDQGGLGALTQDQLDALYLYGGITLAVYIFLQWMFAFTGLSAG